VDLLRHGEDQKKEAELIFLILIQIQPQDIHFGN